MTSRGQTHNVLMACLCPSRKMPGQFNDILRPETEERTDFDVRVTAYGLRFNSLKNKTNKVK